MARVACWASALAFSIAALGCGKDFVFGHSRTDGGPEAGAGGESETGGRHGTGGKKATGGTEHGGAGGTAGSGGAGGAQTGGQGGASGAGGNDSGAAGAGGADSSVDPCGPAPTAPPNAIVAHCTIGNAPVIDGRLDDWPSLLFTNTVNHATGEAFGVWDSDESANAANLSAGFGVRWDRDALYVAATVVDDVRSTPDPAHFYMNDAFEVFLDGNGDAGEYGSDDIQLLFDAAGRSQANRYPTLDPFAVPSGVTSAVAPAGPAQDWNVEIRIPWAVLGVSPRVIGDVIGFDVGLDDNDTGARDRALIWRNSAPNGCACAAAPNPMPCEPYCHTMTFAKVILGGR